MTEAKSLITEKKLHTVRDRSGVTRTQTSEKMWGAVPEVYGSGLEPNLCIPLVCPASEPTSTVAVLQAEEVRGGTRDSEKPKTSRRSMPMQK
jgi:hypothetical protein